MRAWHRCCCDGGCCFWVWRIGKVLSHSFWGLLALCLDWLRRGRHYGDRFFNRFRCVVGYECDWGDLMDIACFRYLLPGWHWKLLLGVDPGAGVASRAGLNWLEGLTGPVKALARWPRDGWMVFVVSAISVLSNTTWGNKTWNKW